MFEPIRGFPSLQRTPQADLKPGTVLALVAGAANAVGFLAVGQYTSHMTGILSSVADNLVHGQLVLAGAGVAFLLVLPRRWTTGSACAHADRRSAAAVQVRIAHRQG
ncbi:MAG: DUF1275 family protein [Hydrogenophaga sp.]|uniref:DUF1275 family protein n=1 Tax=Hydrogenophaga sp. TaxID=1904254 RepID=UPI002730B7FB|nr:DUF1275 family protein [Hydrogenophaga sp.]MDP2165062.1 DUF1275 family protein [Hydrogenophaga sp.]MDP3476802.1 DUF1275 family protein [Hydrogenophaga sp.]